VAGWLGLAPALRGNIREINFLVIAIRKGNVLLVI
jgi:hypothetical protein